MSRHPARHLPRLAHVALAALFALPVLVGGSRDASAAAPRLSWTYRNREHKFSMKMLDDYKAVPQKTDEDTVVSRFHDAKSKIDIRRGWPVDIQVVRIALAGQDGPVTTGGGPARQRRRMRPKPTTVWEAMEQSLGRFAVSPQPPFALRPEVAKALEAQRKTFKAIKSKDKAKVPGKLWQLTVPVKNPYAGDEMHVSLAEFTRDGWSIGIVMRCGTKFAKDYASRFKSIAKSFKWKDSRAKDVESLSQLDGVNITAQKRREIETGMVKGWDVIVSPKKNYIILYNTKNNKNNLLARVIAKRIEMIREQIYEVQFPPAKPITTVCIVRVCADRKEYHAYGGPGGSAGYWSSGDEELVFYDASASKKPDDNTLSVLYHEAFHQYIYYSVGNVAPHSWFNEGHGDYYAGAKLKGRKFVIEPFDWRVGVVRNAIVKGPRGFSLAKKDGMAYRQWERNGGYTPLEHLVRFTQGEYYAYPGISYAQGWALIYFLREIVPKNKKYRAKWGKILDTYFDVLQAEVNRGGALVPGRAGPQDDDTEKPDGKEDGEKPEDVPGPDGGGPQPEPEGDKPDDDDGDGEGKGEDEKPDEPAPDVARVIRRGLGGTAALEKAVAAAFKDVDWAEFEEAWLKATK